MPEQSLSEQAPSEHQPNLLPEPTGEPLVCKVISVDDHVTEPPTVFEGRIEAKFADRAPRLVEHASGGLVWAYEDGEMHDSGFGAVAGRPQEDWRHEPIRYEEVRKGVWDIDAAGAGHGSRRRRGVGHVPIDVRVRWPSVRS